jgi:demethylmenaquinone methyltransferase/2-methoxy-6-polyprenyl-1,4-benzoquinol methylase
MPIQVETPPTDGRDQQPDEVRALFSRIARRYDLMNRIMTLGQDRSWRREAIHQARLPSRGRLLDLGAGTGDMLMEAARQHPQVQVVGLDFTPQMMAIGRRRMHQNGPVPAKAAWIEGDALRLPLSDQRFDAVVSAFLMRNVSDTRQCLMEQRRILKPGGRIVILDTTPSQRSPLSPLIDFYWRAIVPQLGQWIAGEREAYTYLPESTHNFLPAEQLAGQMVKSGFQEVGFRRLMFSTIAIHWGRK